ERTARVGDGDRVDLAVRLEVARLLLRGAEVDEAVVPVDRPAELARRGLGDRHLDVLARAVVGVDRDGVLARADSRRGLPAVGRAAPHDVAALDGRVRGRAVAGADVLDHELVLAHLDLDVGADVLLVLHRVVPVAARVERVRALALDAGAG